MNTPNPDTGHVAIVAAFGDQLNTETGDPS
jgi:hypothetical protein